MAEAWPYERGWGAGDGAGGIRSRRHRALLLGAQSAGPAFYALVLLLLIVSVSLLAPLMMPYGRDTMDLDRILDGPSPGHVLGTDELGRDLLTRILYGGRFTLLVAMVSVAIATLIGVAVGSLGGYYGGAVDHLASGAVDLFLSIPVFLVLLVAAAFGGGRLWTIPLIIGVTSWMETARVVRSAVLAIKGEEYVEAARSMGVGTPALLLRHILPHAVPPVLVSATVGFASAMLLESALSFLGYGVQPPLPTWGNMLQNAQIFIRRAPVAAFAPGFMIFITCLCFHYVSEGLHRAMDRGYSRESR